MRPTGMSPESSGETDGVELSQLSRMFAIEGDLQEVGHDSRISVDALMTLVLLQQEGVASPTRISSRLSFAPSKTTRHIELLLRYRLVDEALDPRDLRRSVVSATPRGLRLVAELERVAGAEWLGVVLDHFINFRCALRDYSAHHSGCFLTDGKARLLVIAHLAGRPLGISELATYASLKQPSVSMMVKWLITHGLMKADSGPSVDRRIRRVCLTAGGADAAREILGGLEADEVPNH